MKALRDKASFVRLFALVAVLALVAAACTGGESVEDTADTGDTETTTAPTDDGAADTTAPEDTGDTGDTTDTTAADGAAGGDLETYTMGIFEDITTTNYWDTLDTGSTVWNSYVFDPTHDTLYGIDYPGLEVTPELAASELPEAVQEGDQWVAEVPMKEGATWSDGEPITAEDVAFTWNVATEFELGSNWVDVTDVDAGVVSVEAADETTVRVTFDNEPGIAVWGLGQGVPFMPIMPEHFWADVVEEARGSDDPRAALLAASGAEEPASGPTVFSEREEGSFAATTANESYHDSGSEVTSGDVTYTEGPYAQNYQFTFYGGQDAAVLALANGESDYLLNPLGMQRGLQQQVEGNEDLTAIVNPTNGFRYMAFNLTQAPMSDIAFRRALSVLIDKEFVTESVLQGVAFPVYSMIPEGNEAWYNEEVANQIAESQMAGAETDDRRAEAISILSEAGYTWETAPGWDDPETDEVERAAQPSEGAAFVAGEGLIDPDGNTLEQLELITPTASYDPLRSAFGNYISGAALELGIPIVSIPTDFNTIVQQVFVPNDAGELTYDMFILGWSLGNPALPTFHEAFFGSANLTVVNDGNNNTGYENEEFDSFAQDLQNATTEEEAYEAIWNMEQNLAENLPYITLFDTGILEFYNNRVEYPFTETLGGLQFITGAQELVTSS